MSIEHICDEVARIIKKYDETDPVELARAMKIILLYEAMGDYDEACKGFYLYQSRKKIITINSDLPRMIQRIILAHEIGHAVLHPQAASGSRVSRLSSAASIPFNFILNINLPDIGLNGRFFN